MPRIYISPDDAKPIAGYPCGGDRRTVLPFHESVGPYRFVDAVAFDSVQPLEADLEADLEARLPRYERAKPVSDAEQIKRRLAFLGPCTTRIEYRRALEAFALPVAWLPPSPERDAAAAETDAIFPWDSEGARHDVAAVEAEERRKAEAEAEAERARLAALPNTKTLKELGFVGVLLPLGSTPSSWPRRLLQPSQEFSFDEQWVTDAMHVEGGRMVIFDATSALDIEWREGKIPGSTASIVTSYVPARAPAKGRKMVNLDAWLDLRFADDSPVTAFRDARTEDGRKAEEAFCEFIRPFMSRVVSHDDSERRTYSRLFFQAGGRAFSLRRELLRSVYREMVAQLPRVPSRPDPLTYAASDSRIDKLTDEAIQGKRPWFAVDELFVSADDWEAMQREAVHAWTKPIDEAIADKDEVTTEELEAALLASGAIAAPLENAGHTRLVAHMNERGFEKRQVTRGEKRVRAFVRRPEGEHKVSFTARVKGALGIE